MAPLFYCGKPKALMTRPLNDRPQTQNEDRIQYRSHTVQVSLHTHTLSKTTLGSRDAMATSTHYSYLQPEQLGEDVGTVIALAAFGDANMGCVDFWFRSAGSEQLLREPRRTSVGGHGARASKRQEEVALSRGILLKRRP